MFKGEHVGNQFVFAEFKILKRNCLHLNHRYNYEEMWVPRREKERSREMVTTEQYVFVIARHFQNITCKRLYHIVFGMKSLCIVLKTFDTTNKFVAEWSDLNCIKLFFFSCAAGHTLFHINQIKTVMFILKLYF